MQVPYLEDQGQISLQMVEGMGDGGMGFSFQETYLPALQKAVEKDEDLTSSKVVGSTHPPQVPENLPYLPLQTFLLRLEEKVVCRAVGIPGYPKNVCLEMVKPVVGGKMI